MSDKTKKILLLNYHSEETEQAINLFQQFHVTTAESLEDVAEKGKDDFDLVITGYVVPAVSGDSSFSYLKDIDTAIKNLESEIRKNKIDEIIEREFKKKQDQILQRLNDAIETGQREKAENEANIKTMEKMRAEALGFKEQAEQKLEEAKKQVESAEKRVEAAEQSIREAQIIADEARKSEEILQRTTEVALKEKQAAEDAQKEAERKAELALKERQDAENIAEAALLEKQAADSKIDEALAEKTAIINKLTSDIDILNEQREAAEENIRLMQIEHKKTQTKLAKLQETWESYNA